MELIKDLGTLPYGKTGQVKRFGIYKCPTCNIEYTCRTDHVKSGRTTQCKDCAFNNRNKENQRIFISTFIDRAIATHGNLYDYSISFCTGARNLVDIKCTRCASVFSQLAYRHLLGNGCPKCAKEDNSIATRVYSTRPTFLYLVYFNRFDMYKIGCTSTSIENRFNKDNENPEVVFSKLFEDGGVAYRYEAEILNKYKEFLYKGSKVLRSGNSELFSIDISSLVEQYFK